VWCDQAARLGVTSPRPGPTRARSTFGIEAPFSGRVRAVRAHRSPLRGGSQAPSIFAEDSSATWVGLKRPRFDAAPV
jgi:hypothetical protein